EHGLSLSSFESPLISIFDIKGRISFLIARKKAYFHRLFQQPQNAILNVLWYDGGWICELTEEETIT
ncbi:hypothetical protein, partial [Anoxynatronum sibiricum]